MTMESVKIYMDALETSGKMIDKHIVVDSNFPTLISLMKYQVHGVPTVSGLDVNDYPDVNGSLMSSSKMNQIRFQNKVPLPSEVMEHFTHMQCHCMMGLFTDITKAWLTIDSDIYIWSYENESDVAYFDGLNETILCVGLVKPKAGVFQSHVKYLLVLTTIVEIKVLGVTFDDEMQLVREPIFNIATDGIAITAIANTSCGRIFLGSRNGFLFEIQYNAKNGWFGKKCKMINHCEGTFSFLVPSFLYPEEEAVQQITVDDSRNILFTLGAKGTINVWDINNQKACRVTSLTQSVLVQNLVLNVVKTLDSNNFRPLVSISAVTESESLHINLVAVASTGARFYFSCTSLANPLARPHCLQLIHIRLPPGYAANASVMRPRKVQMAHYKRGTVILICGGESESMWCLSNNIHPFSVNLAESQSILPLESPVWAMAEIPSNSPILTEKLSGKQIDPPLLVQQHTEEARKFIFLTAQGATIFVQDRPVDVLKHLLLEQRGPDTEAVKYYFYTQSPEQACATCLTLIASESSKNNQLCEWATRAFFLYGNQKISSYLIGDARTSTPRSSLSESCLNMIRQPQIHHNVNVDSDLQQFSAKHGGLYLYTGRLLRTIWNLRCIRQEQCGDKVLISSMVTSHQLRWILGHLHALKTFLFANSQNRKPYNKAIKNIIDEYDSRLNLSQEPLAEEKNSLDALKIFVTHACEVLGLWNILCENQLQSIINLLPKDYGNQLFSSTFRDLMLIGQDVLSLLILYLVESYLEDNASIDVISAKLRDVCPNLYRNEHATCSKANELVLKAKTTPNSEERDIYLQSALKLCKDIAPKLNISTICQQFISCHFHRGVLELCLCCAKRIDPNNSALHYYKNKETINEDQEENFAYLKRIAIYKEHTSMLDYLYNQSLTMTPKIETTGQITEKEMLHKAIYDALQSECEILHGTVYAWMIDKGLHSELVALASPSLELYLINVNAPELLWQYYERNKNHAAAAKVLNALATKTDREIDLAHRIEYLARAIICMRSDEVGYAPHLGVFLRELEDKIEIARIQKLILDTLCNQSGKYDASALRDVNIRLNSSLLDITQLYEDYAQKFQLWECKLAIIHCSGHQDLMLIQGIWKNIIENELRNLSQVDPEDKMAILTNKIKLLGQNYTGNPHCFPVDFLIKELEICACRLKVSNDHIISCFLQLGKSVDELLDYYDKMIGANNRIWLNEGNEFHLIESVQNVVNYFLQNVNVKNNFLRRKIIIKCQDVISKCLTTVFSKPNSNRLIERLRTTQSTLSQL